MYSSQPAPLSERLMSGRLQGIDPGTNGGLAAGASVRAPRRAASGRAAAATPRRLSTAPLDGESSWKRWGAALGLSAAGLLGILALVGLRPADISQAGAQGPETALGRSADLARASRIALLPPARSGSVAASVSPAAARPESRDARVAGAAGDVEIDDPWKAIFGGRPESGPAPAQDGAGAAAPAASSRSATPAPRSRSSGADAVAADGGARAIKGGRQRRTTVTVEEQEDQEILIPSAPVTVQRARVLYRPQPEYPPSAIKARQQGSVQVKMLVSTLGTVKQLEILKADPPGAFEESVKAATQLWRFSPARDSAGNAVEDSKEFEYVFSLR
jgi:protein TonB